jgi:hypothetical protein
MAGFLLILCEIAGRETTLQALGHAMQTCGWLANYSGDYNSSANWDADFLPRRHEEHEGHEE